SGPTASSVSPGHTTIAASSGVPAPCNLNTATSTSQKRKRKAPPVTSVTPPMAPLSGTLSLSCINY
ncbi:hypothetical protein J4Q44_G00087900, partial [Coregonus suidteri]